MTLAPSEQFDRQSDVTAANPDATALAAERQQSLMARIQDLSANQQEVLRLKFHGELSYEQIADVTGLSKTNVGYLLHTAISKLRRQIT